MMLCFFHGQERETILLDWEMQICRKQKEYEETNQQKQKQVSRKEKELEEAIQVVDVRISEAEEREVLFKRVKLRFMENAGFGCCVGCKENLYQCVLWNENLLDDGVVWILQVQSEKETELRNLESSLNGLEKELNQKLKDASEQHSKYVKNCRSLEKAEAANEKAQSEVFITSLQMSSAVRKKRISFIKPDVP